MGTEQTPNWHVTVCVHRPITGAQADGLFDTLADAAHGWEPAGVDVDVSGGPCCCRESPSGPPSFGAALGTILGASSGASQAGEDQAGVDRAVRDALRHAGRVVDAARRWRAAYHEVPILAGNEYAGAIRYVDARAALLAAVDALETDADPATERDFDQAAAAAVAAAEPHGGPGWDQDVIADLARCLRRYGYAPPQPQP
jgi:hypothetical protein